MQTCATLAIRGCGDLTSGVVTEEVGAAVGLDPGGAAVAQIVAAGFAFEDFAFFVDVGDGFWATDFIITFGGGGSVGERDGLDLAIESASVFKNGGLVCLGVVDDAGEFATSVVFVHDGSSIGVVQAGEAAFWSVLISDFSFSISAFPNSG